MKSTRMLACGMALAVLVSCRDNDSTPEPAAASPLAASGSGGAELIVPEGMDRAGLSIAQTDDRLHDPGMKSIGRGYLAGPTGTVFPQPVTVRLPILQSDLAAWRGKVQDVAIFTRGDGEGRFHRLPTRLVNDGQMVEADVLHFSEFSVALGVADKCLVAGQSVDCISPICYFDAQENDVQALSNLIGAHSMESVARSAAQAFAVGACTHARAHEFTDAVASLGSLENALVADLATGAVDSTTYSALRDAIRVAETAILQIPSVVVTGTWLANVPVNGKSRRLTLQLHQRADGSVTGYVVGGGISWSVASGHIAADHLTLGLRLHDSAVDRTFTISGAVTPASASGPASFVGLVAPPVDPVGTASTQGNPGPAATAGDSTPVVWHRTEQELTERRFKFLVDPIQGVWITVAIVVSGETGLISGSFALNPCADSICTGEVYDLAEDGNGHLRILVETFAGNLATVDAAFGSTDTADRLYRVYTGYAQLVGDGSTITTMPVIGFRGNRTTTVHAGHTLAMFATIADALIGPDISNLELSEPCSPVSSAYKHDGATAEDLVGEFASEVTAHTPTTVEFTGFQNLATLRDPRSFDILAPTLGGDPAADPVFSVDFNDRRVGTTTLGGPGTEYFKGPDVPPYDSLRYLIVTPHDGIDDIQLAGNQRDRPDMELPFAFDDTDGLDVLPNLFSFTSFGVHSHSGESENPRGTDSFKFSFEHPPTPMPSVVAPADLTVLFSVATDPLVQVDCQNGQPADLLAQAGPYSISLRVANCTWPSLPAPFQQGVRLGAVALSHGPHPGYLLDITTGTTPDTPFCPYWRLTPEARARVLKIRNAHPYSEELTEPFLCNAHQDKALTEVSQEWRLPPETTKRHADSPDTFVLRRTIPFDEATNLLPPAYRMEVTDIGGATTQYDLSCTPPWGDPARHWWTCAVGGSPDSIMSMRVTASATGAAMELDLTGPDLLVPEVYVGDRGFSNCIDDGNPCTDEFETAPGVCAHINNSAPCFSGSPCTDGDQCVDGQCMGGGPRDCDDGNVCTDDSCDPATGCTHVANTTPCNDSNACTQTDVCTGGACVGGNPVNCNPQDQCHVVGACNASTGACDSPKKPDGTACNDFDPCTSDDACLEGFCISFIQSPCDDNNDCTDDHCDPEFGCQHAPNHKHFDAGGTTREPDSCVLGVRRGQLDPLPCEMMVSDHCGCSLLDPQAIGLDCARSLLAATGFNLEACIAGCQNAGGLDCTMHCAKTGVRLVTAGRWFQCPTTGIAPTCPCEQACQEDPDACVDCHQPCFTPIGTCDLQNDYCDDDAYCGDVYPPCVTVHCGSEHLCVYDPEPGRCLIDGSCFGLGDLNPDDPCVFCDPSLPSQWSPVPCRDFDPSTVDTCDSTTGTCVHSPIQDYCDDGNPCTTDLWVALESHCFHIPRASFTPCTQPCFPDARCNATGHCETGAMLGIGARCDDGNGCTLYDQCSSDGACVGTPRDCDDKNPCTGAIDGTGDYCDPKRPADEACVFTPLPGAWCFAADGQCMVGQCDQNGRCLAVADLDIACDLGNNCTTGDHCVGGTCVMGAAADACSGANLAPCSGSSPDNCEDLPGGNCTFKWTGTEWDPVSKDAGCSGWAIQNTASCSSNPAIRCPFATLRFYHKDLTKEDPDLYPRPLDDPDRLPLLISFDATLTCSSDCAGAAVGFKWLNAIQCYDHCGSCNYYDDNWSGCWPPEMALPVPNQLWMHPGQWPTGFPSTPTFSSGAIKRFFGHIHALLASGVSPRTDPGTSIHGEFIFYSRRATAGLQLGLTYPADQDMNPLPDVLTITVHVKRIRNVQKFVVSNSDVVMTLSSVGYVTSLRRLDALGGAELLSDYSPISWAVRGAEKVASAAERLIPIASQSTAPDPSHPPALFSLWYPDNGVVSATDDSIATTLEVTAEPDYFVFRFPTGFSSVTPVDEADLFSLLPYFIAQAKTSNELEEHDSAGTVKPVTGSLPLNKQVGCFDEQDRLDYGLAGCRANRWLGFTGAAAALVTVPWKLFLTTVEGMVNGDPIPGLDLHLPNVRLGGHWLRSDSASPVDRSYLFAQLDNGYLGGSGAWGIDGPTMHGMAGLAGLPTAVLQEVISGNWGSGYYKTCESVETSQTGVVTTCTMDSASPEFQAFVASAQSVEGPEADGVSVGIHSQNLGGLSGSSGWTSEFLNHVLSPLAVRYLYLDGGDHYVDPTTCQPGAEPDEPLCCPDPKNSKEKLLVTAANACGFAKGALGAYIEPLMASQTPPGSPPFVGASVDWDQSFSWFYRTSNSLDLGVLRQKELVRTHLVPIALQEGPLSRQRTEMGWFKYQDSAYDSLGGSQFDSDAVSLDDVHYIMTKALALDRAIQLGWDAHAPLFADVPGICELVPPTPGAFPHRTAVLCLVHDYLALMAEPDMRDPEKSGKLKQELSDPFMEAELDHHTLQLTKKKVFSVLPEGGTKYFDNPFASQPLRIQLRAKFNYDRSGSVAALPTGNPPTTLPCRVWSNGATQAVAIPQNVTNTVYIPRDARRILRCTWDLGTLPQTLFLDRRGVNLNFTAIHGSAMLLLRLHSGGWFRDFVAQVRDGADGTPATASPIRFYEPTVDQVDFVEGDLDTTDSLHRRKRAVDSNGLVEPWQEAGTQIGQGGVTQTYRQSDDGPDLPFGYQRSWLFDWRNVAQAELFTFVLPTPDITADSAHAFLGPTTAGPSFSLTVPGSPAAFFAVQELPADTTHTNAAFPVFLNGTEFTIVVPGVEFGLGTTDTAVIDFSVESANSWHYYAYDRDWNLNTSGFLATPAAGPEALVVNGLNSFAIHQSPSPGLATDYAAPRFEARITVIDSAPAWPPP